MKIKVAKSFERDVDKIRDKKLLRASLKTSSSLRGSARLNDVVGQEATEAIFQLKE